jgi:hypothetical protein
LALGSFGSLWLFGSKESEIQKAILEWLAYKRICHWRNNSGAMVSEYKGKRRFMRFGKVGSPDIFAVKDGVCYGIEVKRPGGKQSDAQREFQARLEAAGGRYLLVYSIEDVEKGINQDNGGGGSGGGFGSSGFLAKNPK